MTQREAALVLPETGPGRVEVDHAIVLFDGVCNLCNNSVNFIIDRDSAGHFKFASLQSEEGQALLQRFAYPADYLNSILLVENGTCYHSSSAALRIAKKLGRGWPLFYAFIVIPPPLRNLIYDWIAKNRYRWFGKQDHCRIPTPELRARFL